MNVPVLFSRRRVLQGMGVLAASTMLPSSILPAFATSSSVADFVRVSAMLTGREKFSQEFSGALLAAFTKIDSTFADKLARLRAYIDANALKGSDLIAKLHADSSLSDIQELPGNILTGWYLGIVGSGDKAICVAYTQALANVEVAHVLRPPSYAYGAYGSWASKPA
ncbi:sugar dehydrogenase complex small subunit [Rouxiella sp. WC2420]|uniref:Sugar dehydrogenase complex small subunit n=1 Tax=Rouxiella sp. WC2420 TaxID=3234145 RepID=A0AB39VLP0_9GAMM